MSLGVCGAFHSLGESEVGQILEEAGRVGIGEVLQVVVQIAKEDEGAGVEDHGGYKVHNATAEVVTWSRRAVNEGGSQGAVVGGEECEGHVFHVADGAF